MVMEVVESYGDWRQPRTPSRQAAAASILSPHDQSPVAGADVNFNSPGHRSSQDGSFIQDEDMQLILELGVKGTSTSATIGKTSGVVGRNVGILSESWMDRHAKWATDFDANVAELDFDQFTRQDIRTLRAEYQLGKSTNEEETVDFAWDSFTTNTHDPTMPTNRTAPDCNHNNNKMRIRPTCNSLDTSLAASLFSSVGAGVGGGSEDALAVILHNQPDGATGFISTDSLDFSSMAGQEEMIRQACTTKKRDYMLTFGGAAGLTGGAVGPEDNDYQDAQLSDAKEKPSMLGGRGFGSEPGMGMEEDNEQLVAWGKVKRSYETDEKSDYEIFTGRVNSLPNLNRSSGQDSICGIGGGERMLSGNGERYVPIYTLKQSWMMESGENYTEMEENTGENGVSRCSEGNTSTTGIGRLSLLQAFKTKMGGTLERLAQLQIEETVDRSTGDSSGYMTGTGSQHACGGARPKIQQKTMVEVDDDEKEAMEESQTTREDYRYAEFFVNGRYIDINHNEVGFVPPSTRGIQQSPSSQQQFFINEQQQEEPAVVSSPPPQLTSFHQQAIKGRTTRPPAKPPRTFATLLQLQREDSEDYVVQQRPERAPIGRRILPKVPAEYEQSGTEISRMKDSATQVPIYVVDQSVQTADGDRAKCEMTGQKIDPESAGDCGPSLSKSTDWKHPFFGSATSATFINVPELNFLKFPFNVPALFPHVAPFPLAFLTDGPDISSLVAKQAKLINASEQQLAAPARLLPSPPPALGGVLSKSKCQMLGGGIPQSLQTLLGLGGESRLRGDSGLASSAVGPPHIQDWESLATLLPKDVLQTYSFFKTNSDLLGKSTRPDLNIDKRLILKSGNCCNGKRNSTNTKKLRSTGKRQRRCSEPGSNKRKQFESILEEGGCCGRVCCGHHFHHCHVTTWCCTTPHPAHAPPAETCQCRSRIQCGKCGGRRWDGVAVEDTEDEIEWNMNGHRYKPMNELAEKMGGESSEEERLVQDDEMEEMPVKTIRSEYQHGHSNYIPQFYSVQNEKVNQFGCPVKPCATCYRVRSPMEKWNAKQVEVCNCKTSDILEEMGKKTENLKDVHKEDDKKMAAKMYKQKRALVQGVVASCSMLHRRLGEYQREESLSMETAQAASAIIRYSLCPTVERLVADGLVPGKTVWTVVLASTTLGPATKSIYELVKDLDQSVGYDGEHSLLFVAFVNGLLRLRSLDCWLSYLALKDRVLNEFYESSSFFRSASSTYRALFNEVLSGIQPLSLLPFHQFQLDPSNLTAFSPADFGNGQDGSCSISTSVGGLEITVSLHKEIAVTFQKPVGSEESEKMGYSLIPSRLPRDSRVPKSSSTPSRMAGRNGEPRKSISAQGSFGQWKNGGKWKEIEKKRENGEKRPSRIPILKSSRSCLDGKRQRWWTRKQCLGKEKTMAADLVDSESAMSVTASTFSEMDAPDCNGGNGSSDARFVYAIDEENGDGKKDVLAFSKGDTMVLLEDKEDGLLRCQRGNEIGFVPRKKVTYVTFL